jgi:hypothetical protein
MNAATAGRLVIAPAPLHQAAFAIHVPGPRPVRESVVRAVLVAPFWGRIEISVDTEEFLARQILEPHVHVFVVVEGAAGRDLFGRERDVEVVVELGGLRPSNRSAEVTLLLFLHDERLAGFEPFRLRGDPWAAHRALLRTRFSHRYCHADPRGVNGVPALSSNGCGRDRHRGRYPAKYGGREPMRGMGASKAATAPEGGNVDELSRPETSRR